MYEFGWSRDVIGSVLEIDGLLGPTILKRCDDVIEVLPSQGKLLR